MNGSYEPTDRFTHSIFKIYLANIFSVAVYHARLSGYQDKMDPVFVLYLKESCVGKKKRKHLSLLLPVFLLHAHTNTA